MTTAEPNYAKPFAGLKVADFSQGYAGPSCAGLFAQYGADVIKVEPAEGDWIRYLGTRQGDQTAMAVTVNRGKRSIVLDLKSDGGLAVARRLARTADVLVESFRPGVMARFGLDYDSVRAANPGIIYVAVSGYGHTGPYADRPCTDTAMQAFSGLMSVNPGNDGIPHRLGFIVVDAVTGLYAYQAAATAVHARGSSAVGRFVDCSLMQAAAAIQAANIAEFQLAGGAPKPLNAPAGTYATADGHVAVTLVKEDQFRRLCAVLGAPEIPGDPRYATFEARAANMDTLGPRVQALLARRTTAEWVRTCAENDVLAQPINSYGDWLADPHVQASGAAPAIRHGPAGAVAIPDAPGVSPAAPGEPAQQAPGMGQHTTEILQELGYGGGEIHGLMQDRAVA